MKTVIVVETNEDESLNGNGWGYPANSRNGKDGTGNGRGYTIGESVYGEDTTGDGWGCGIDPNTWDISDEPSESCSRAHLVATVGDTIIVESLR